MGQHIDAEVPQCVLGYKANFGKQFSTFEIPNNNMNQEKPARTVPKLLHDFTNGFVSTVTLSKNKSVTFCYFYRSKTRYL